MIPICYALFQKTVAEEILPYSVYEAGQHCPNTRSKERYYKKENYRSTSLMNKDAKINKILVNGIQQYIKELYTMTKLNLF